MSDIFAIFYNQKKSAAFYQISIQAFGMKIFTKLNFLMFIICLPETVVISNAKKYLYCCL